MCEQVRVCNITVAFQRDESVRVTEIIIVNHDDKGEELQGMRVICLDDGTIRGGVNLIDGVDIIGVAKMGY